MSRPRTYTSYDRSSAAPSGRTSSIAAMLQSPRYGTARCAEVVREFRSAADWRTRAAEALPPEIADDVPLDPVGLITGLPAGAAQIPWAGPLVRIIG